MAVQVKLKDIIEGLEFLPDEGTSYLNTTTGEVVSITDEELRVLSRILLIHDFRYDLPLTTSLDERGRHG